MPWARRGHLLPRPPRSLRFRSGRRPYHFSAVAVDPPRDGNVAADVRIGVAAQLIRAGPIRCVAAPGRLRAAIPPDPPWPAAPAPHRAHAHRYPGQRSGRPTSPAPPPAPADSADSAVAALPRAAPQPVPPRGRRAPTAIRAPAAAPAPARARAPPRRNQDP